METAWKCTRAQACVQFVHSMCTNLDTPCTLKLLLGHPLYTGAVYMLAHRLGHMCTFPSSFQAWALQLSQQCAPSFLQFPIVQGVQNNMYRQYMYSQLIHFMPRGFKMAISKHLPEQPYLLSQCQYCSKWRSNT